MGSSSAHRRSILGLFPAHLHHVCQQHDVDLKNGLGRAPLLEALCRKYPMLAVSGAGRGYSPLLPTMSTENVRPALTPLAGTLDSKGNPSGNALCRIDQAGDAPRILEFVCGPSIGGQLRHPSGPGGVRTQERADHDGPHSPIESWW